MKSLFFSTFFLLFCFQIKAQNVPVYDTYSVLKKEVLNDPNTVYVVNFWATWCAPCVKELPHFEKLNAENKAIKVVLVSLDFKDQYDKKLLPFIKKKNIQSQVVQLTDKDYNTWLPQIDANWSGSIPATMVIKGDEKYFVEKMFASEEELNEFIESSIN